MNSWSQLHLRTTTISQVKNQAIGREACPTVLNTKQQLEEGTNLVPGSQKVQTSSYKINKYQGWDVQHDKYNEHCSVLYRKVVERVNPRTSHHTEKSFSLFL